MTLRIDETRLARFGERDLGGLIRIYEANYTCIAKLVPDLATLDSAMVSRVAGALDLYIEPLERHKYTMSLKLTYKFPSGDGCDCVFEPNARIHVYHDAQAAEIVSHCYPPNQRQPYAWVRMPELNRKWQMNYFLLKWLRFCTTQGHLFISGITPIHDGLSLGDDLDIYRFDD